MEPDLRRLAFDIQRLLRLVEEGRGLRLPKIGTGVIVELDRPVLQAHQLRLTRVGIKRPKSPDRRQGKSGSCFHSAGRRCHWRSRRFIGGQCVVGHPLRLVSERRPFLCSRRLRSGGLRSQAGGLQKQKAGARDSNRTAERSNTNQPDCHRPEFSLWMPPLATAKTLYFAIDSPPPIGGRPSISESPLSSEWEAGSLQSRGTCA